MEKFIPNSEQLEKAKRVAAKHNVSAIYMNRGGDLFLQEILAKNSVKGTADYALINITADGDAVPRKMIQHTITQEDLDNNPIFREYYQVGHVLEIPEPANEWPEVPLEGEALPEGVERTGKEMTANGEVGSTELTPPGEPGTTALPFDVTELSEKQVKARLPEVIDAEIANRILQAEEAGAKRKGVMAAINDRIAELAQ